MAGGLVDSSGDELKNLATPTTCIPLYSGRPTIVNLLLPLINSVVMPGGGLERLINDPFTVHKTTSAVLCIHLNSAVSPTDMVLDSGISINVPKILLISKVNSVHGDTDPFLHLIQYTE